MFDSVRRTMGGGSMPSTPTRNFFLTPALNAYIRDQVASGHYGNTSEVVRATLHLLIERDEASGAAVIRSAEAGNPTRG